MTGPEAYLAGFRVYVDRMAMAADWIFPREPFIEFEKSDEWWCRKYGVGHEGPRRPAIFQIGGDLIVHPDLIPALKEACPNWLLWGD